MPVHLNMSPIILRVLRLLFMKLLGMTSLLVATCFSVTILLLIATIDVQIFSEDGSVERTNLDLKLGRGVSKTLPTFDGRGNPKFHHHVRRPQSSSDDVERLVGPEWDVHNFSDVFLPEPDCSVPPFLLIIVTSAPANSDRRKAIRNTWARYRNLKQLNHTHFRTVFLIGRTTPVLSEMVEAESEKHKDILFGDYQDSYRNLTLKVQHGVTWAAESCQSQYLLKTDDDCFVNTRVLIEFLQNYNQQTTNLYVGHKLRSQDVVRDPMSKWYVSERDYPRDRYPPYASGTGYLLSSDVVHQMARRSSFHHPFPVEDAYTGVLMEDLGVGLLDTARFALFSTKWTMCNYLYFFVVHAVTPEQQYVCLRYSDESRSKCKHSEELQQWE